MMNRNRYNLVVGIILTTMMCSCTTYYFTPSSLNKQLSQIDTNSIHEVYDFRFGVLGVVAGGKHFYNMINEVVVTDKTGKADTLAVTAHMAVKITDKHGEHKIVLFDSMFIRDSLLYGNKSHIINIPIKPFHLRDIAKLELQK
jgi:hypothetical protein